MEEFANIFLIFIIYSFFGWLIEEIDCSIIAKKFVNRGFLIGPVCPIYGSGAIIISLLLQNYKDNWVIVFCMAMILAGALEYFTSWIMEKLFKARWWDYSHKKYNINGRICLETMMPFGLMGLLLTYVLNPFFYEILGKIPQNILNISAIVLGIIFLIDIILSFKVISKVSSTVKKVSKDNTNDINKKVREVLKDSWKEKRLVDAFPNFETIKEKVKNVAKTTAKKGRRAIKKANIQGIRIIEKGKKMAVAKLDTNKKIKKQDKN